MKPLPAASAITYRCLVLVAALAPTGAYAETPRSPFGIEWFLDCRSRRSNAWTRKSSNAPNAASSPRPWTMGARAWSHQLRHHPCRRQTAAVTPRRDIRQPGCPGLDAGGAFAVHLATVWKHYARQPDWGDTYRQLADTYDVIEVTAGPGRLPGSRLECRSDARIVPQADVSEDRSAANLAAARQNARLIAQACASHPLTPYITTEQTARDLEFVRKQLGELQFNYLGNAYGTWLGAWYGGLFPANVGRMVLDSNINWTSTFEHASVIVASEKEKIFERFVAQAAALDPGVYPAGRHAGRRAPSCSWNCCPACVPHCVPATVSTATRRPDGRPRAQSLAAGHSRRRRPGA